MFEKVLIAEDFDIIKSGLYATLNEINIPKIAHAAYCDEALLKLKKAKLDNKPYDLLISDLSFLEDHNTQQITTGEDLIKSVKKEFPELKIIVFSVEDKPYRIQYLQKTLKINAYVWKNRNGQKELKKAISHVSVSNAFYISDDLRATVHPKENIEITEDDILLINYLSKGFLQEAISSKFKQKGIKPASVSTIEKRLKKLKEHFNANNVTHLVAIAKDFGLI